MEAVGIARLVCRGGAVDDPVDCDDGPDHEGKDGDDHDEHPVAAQEPVSLLGLLRGRVGVRARHRRRWFAAVPSLGNHSTGARRYLRRPGRAVAKVVILNTSSESAP